MPNSKKTKSKPSKDDVARLIKGKATVNHVGSRGIWHRLRLDERKKLNVAAERGYLVVTVSTRAALKNAWYLWCQATARTCVVLERGEQSRLHLISEDGEKISGTERSVPHPFGQSDVERVLKEVLSSPDW